MRPVEMFELVPLLNGLNSLRSLDNQETFHPKIGPAAEAQLLHTEQQKIVERARASADFSIWDVGLGAAANALAVIRALENELPTRHGSPVQIHSFDKTLGPVQFALENALELGYLTGFEDKIRQLLKNGNVSFDDRIQWQLHLGNFCETIKTLELRAPDAIFYDPYSVKSNIEMWTLAHFSLLYAKLDPDRPCLITNYTASTYVRVTLLLAGFHVGWGRGIAQKLHTTVFSNRLDLLERPLDLEWLEKRVRISHSADAIRNIPYEIAPISEADYAVLQAHPQFAK